MRPARLLILGVAVVAAGLAGVLAMTLAGRGSVVTQVQSVVEKEPTVRVLVSSANLPVGARLDDKAAHWMGWPQSGVVQGFITEADKPDALKDLQGAVGVVAVIPILIGGGCREGFLNLSDADFEVLREICEYIALALVGRQNRNSRG